MTRVLAIDIGTKLGLCMTFEREIVEIATWNVKLKTTEDLADHERWRRIHKMLEDRVNLYSITHIAFEKVNNATIRGARQAELYWGACAIVNLIAAQYGTKIIPIPVQHVKKRLSGKGNAKKEEMIEAAKKCTRLAIVDDNSADAVGVALAAIDIINGTGVENASGTDRKGGSGKKRSRKAPVSGIRPQTGGVRRSLKARAHSLGRAAD